MSKVFQGRSLQQQECLPSCIGHKKVPVCYILRNGAARGLSYRSNCIHCRSSVQGGGKGFIPLADIGRFGGNELMGRRGGARDCWGILQPSLSALLFQADIKREIGGDRNLDAFRRQ